MGYNPEKDAILQPKKGANFPAFKNLVTTFCMSINLAFPSFLSREYFWRKQALVL